MKLNLELNTKPIHGDNRVFAAAARHGPEAEFILRCVQMRETPDDDARLARLLEHNLDWESVLAMTRSHGVLPLLHQKLDSIGWYRVSSGNRARLEEMFRRNVARNLAMSAELAEIIKIGKNNSVPMIPLKGPVFAQQLYGNMARRVSCDLDLLVRPQDAAKLCELLALRGYKSTLGVVPYYEQAILRWTRQIPLAHQDRPWEVEVHTALLEGPDAAATTFESLNSRLETTQVCGQSIGVPSIDEMLLYLCVHGAKHCWERLGWICDVARVIQLRPDLDWPAIQARARQLHWERALLLGLTLARDLLGITLPESVQQRQPVVRALAKDVADKLFGTRRHRRNAMWRFGFQFGYRESQRDRMWFAWASTMRPTVMECRALYLPPPLSFLYYPFRFVRLAGKCAARMFGGLDADTSREVVAPSTLASKNKT